MLTQTRLKELLHYCPDTGVFKWVKKSSPKSNAIPDTIAGCLNKQRYRIIWIDGKGYKAHSLAFLYVDGIVPKSAIVFMDGVRDNLAYANLSTLYDFRNFQLTQETLQSVLDYNPETGVFTRLVNFAPGALAGSIAGGINKLGYTVISIGLYRLYLHRLAFLYMIGEIPEEVDHINGSPSDNRWENLRGCTHAQNMQNQKLRINNTSGYKGLDFCNGFHRAEIKKDNVRYMELFKNKEEAIKWL